LIPGAPFRRSIRIGRGLLLAVRGLGIGPSHGWTSEPSPTFLGSGAHPSRTGTAEHRAGDRFSREAIARRRRLRLLVAGDRESGGRASECGAASERAHAVPMQGAGQQAPVGAAAPRPQQAPRYDARDSSVSREAVASFTGRPSTVGPLSRVPWSVRAIAFGIVVVVLGVLFGS
jgi:hypothetical protein